VCGYPPPPPPPGGVWGGPPPPSLHYNVGLLGIVPININLHCHKAIKSGCGSAEQRGCKIFDMIPVPAQPARHRYSNGTVPCSATAAVSAAACFLFVPSELPSLWVPGHCDVPPPPLSAL